MFLQIFQTTVVILMCITLIKSEQILNRIPVRQHAMYDLNKNLEWFPAIVGGTPALVGEFPSLVSLQTRDGEHLCSGTLIEFDYILTAGHCVTDNVGNVLKINKLQVMGGDLSITKNASLTRQIRKVINIFLHPEYNYYEAANDIAILKTENFKETNALKPASITFDHPQQGKICRLAGWGTTNENENKPNPVLFKMTLSISNLEQCNASYSGQLKKAMFCAKGQQQDSCQGDSGGALLCNNDVSGIVLFGNACDNYKFHGVYTDVKFYETWIDEVLRTLDANKGENDKTVDKNCSSSKSMNSRTVLVSVLILFNVFL